MSNEKQDDTYPSGQPIVCDHGVPILEPCDQCAGKQTEAQAPERIWLRACHPHSPNHHCSWDVSKTPEDSIEYIRADLATAGTVSIPDAADQVMGRSAQETAENIASITIGKIKPDAYKSLVEMIGTAIETARASVMPDAIAGVERMRGEYEARRAQETHPAFAHYYTVCRNAANEILNGLRSLSPSAAAPHDANEIHFEVVFPDVSQRDAIRRDVMNHLAVVEAKYDAVVQIDTSAEMPSPSAGAGTEDALAAIEQTRQRGWNVVLWCTPRAVVTQITFHDADASPDVDKSCATVTDALATVKEEVKRHAATENRGK